jgi:membrane protein implicated in regulation of membrane protease activity
VLNVYLGAVAFGVTLLLASMVLGGKDAGHDGHVEGDIVGWAPITSLRFWVFLLAFGGGAGVALTLLGSSEWVTAGGALAVGWLSGALAIALVNNLKKNSVSSEVGARELVGTTGTLVLPIAPGKPGKVRVDVKGRQEDFVANLVEDGGELPTGTAVLIIAEGDRGTLLVAKGEM